MVLGLEPRSCLIGGGLCALSKPDMRHQKFQHKYARRVVSVGLQGSYGKDCLIFFKASRLPNINLFWLVDRLNRECLQGSRRA